MPGVTVRLMNTEEHQVMFTDFKNDTVLPEISKPACWATVLNGKIDIIIEGVVTTYAAGDRYYIPFGVKHGAKIYAGYSDITYFDKVIYHEQK